MSCGKIRGPLVCSQQPEAEKHRSRKADLALLMARTKVSAIVKVSISAFLALTLCVAAPSQEQNNRQYLGANTQSARTGLTGAGLGTGTAAAKPGKADGMGNLQQLGGESRPLYRLNRSDVITVNFILSPEYDQILPIQPDGYVFLKDAGSVLAAGLTLDEFEQAVRQAYKGYLHDPQVAVALQEFEHPYFVAGGEVGRPGKYELRANLSLIEAVQIAGGFTHQAKHSKVVLFRHVNEDRMEAHVFDLKAMLKEQSLIENPLIHAGDLVFVPQNSISKIERFISKPGFGVYTSPASF
jgi:polysaccharide export outer membrane protein